MGFTSGVGDLDGSPADQLRLAACRHVEGHVVVLRGLLGWQLGQVPEVVVEVVEQSSGVVRGGVDRVFLRVTT